MLFLVDGGALLPSPEQWPQAWREHHLRRMGNAGGSAAAAAKAAAAGAPAEAGAAGEAEAKAGNGVEVGAATLRGVQ